MREAEPDAVRDVLPARLVGVEKSAFELRPEPFGPTADGRGGDEAGVWAPSRQEAAEIVARHQHITIGHHQPVMRRGAPPFADIVELRIVADRLVADKETRRYIGILGDQTLHRRHDRIASRLSAEDDFIVRIVELKGGAQRLLAMILDPADRTNDADTGCVARRALLRALACELDPLALQEACQTQQAQRSLRFGGCAMLPATANRDQDAADLAGRRHNGKRPGSPNRNRHAGRISRRP